LSDEDHNSYVGGQNNSAYTGSTGQEYTNWENGNREYRAFQDNLNRSSFPSQQPSYGPQGYSQGNYIAINLPTKSHYREKGAIAAALLTAGAYVSYTSISSTYGFYIMILSSVALGIILLSFINESKWFSISLLAISAPLLWAIIELERIHYHTYDDSIAPALFSGLIVLFVSPGIVVAGVRGLKENGERLLTAISIIYVFLLTVWAIWSFGTFGPQRI
jgi:hypothetical protein